jgi:hypothetical protein
MADAGARSTLSFNGGIQIYLQVSPSRALLVPFAPAGPRVSTPVIALSEIGVIVTPDADERIMLGKGAVLGNRGVNLRDHR